MFRIFLLATFISATLLSACSDKKKEKEHMELVAAMKAHCQKTLKMTEEQYIQKYMLHNGNTKEDRRAAIADYEKCLTEKVS